MKIVKQLMKIAIPKEILDQERRVAATPDTVAKMIGQGLQVLVESGAGEGSYFSDDAYCAAGAEIVSDVVELFDRADVIIKVKQPVYNDRLQRHEAEMMKAGQVLIGFLHPASPVNHDMIRILADRNVTALTLDSVPRITRAQSMDALTSMSTVAGYKAVLMAADLLPEFVPMVATAVGAIRPAQVLVVGAGVAGLQAIATAKRLGAVVWAADIRAAAREQAASLGAKIVDLGIPEELAVGEGGYARDLPEKWLSHERDALREAVVDSAIAVLTALIPGRKAPVLVAADTVAAMRPGSVIMDVAVDQGGNCALTRAGETFVHGDVWIDGTTNIPGRVPGTATHLFALNVFNFLKPLISDGGLTLDKDNEIVAECLVTHHGDIVHAGALEAFASKPIAGSGALES